MVKVDVIYTLYDEETGIRIDYTKNFNKVRQWFKEWIISLKKEAHVTKIPMPENSLLGVEIRYYTNGGRRR